VPTITITKAQTALAAEIRGRRSRAKAKRRARRRTQAWLATQLGVKQPIVSKWVRGLSRPEPHLRDAIEVLFPGRVLAADWRTDEEAGLIETLRGVPPSSRKPTIRSRSPRSPLAAPERLLRTGT
jgi:hypothetical protein